MAKANEMIVVSRKEIEKLLRNSQAEEKRLAGEINAYSNVISISRPLSPLLEKAWGDGLKVGYAGYGSEEYLNSTKQQFLNSDL